MTHEQLEELKKDPIKYEQYLEKRRQYRRNYINKLKQDEEKYKTYLEYKRNYQINWVKKHRDLKDSCYENYLNSAKRYQKKNKEKVNEANRKSRQKRGSEYIKNYMKQYRAENRNNIKEKEKVYNIKRKQLQKQQSKHCENCNTNIVNNTYNGLCYDCFIKEESKGNVHCNYPKVYWFNNIDIVVTKWSLLKTIKWYNEYYGSDITKKDTKEIIDIENEGYWDAHTDNKETSILNNLIGTSFYYLKQHKTKDTFGDLQISYGDFYKYISFKEGLLKYYMNIKEPEVMCSTEF